MKMEDYLYKLVQARIVYYSEKLEWYKNKMPKLSGKGKEIALADQAEFDNELVRLQSLLQLVDEGAIVLEDLIRNRSQETLLKPLFKYASRHQCQHEMPRCEDCYNLLGRWAAEYLIEA